MRRKTLDLIKTGALAAAMVISLAACGNGAGSGTGNDTAAEDKAAAEPAVTQEAPAETAEPAALEEAPVETAPSAATEEAAAAVSEPAAESAAESATAAAEETLSGAVFTNDGLKLLVPDEYADGELLIETPQDDADGILFKVTEKASVDAAKARNGNDADTEGIGWLFSIGRVTEDKLHEMLCNDMSGMNVAAKDAEGNFYIFYHPTDVRLERETNEELEAGMEHWGALNEWAWTERDTFAQDNKDRLSPAAYGNSEPQIYLARAAYMPDVNYTVSTLEYAQNGPLSPAGVDAAPYIERLLTDAKFDYDDGEAPDGEYIVLNFPDDNVRFDFFYLDSGRNYVREVRTGDDGDMEILYKVTFNDESTTANDVMDAFVKALAQANGVSQ